jgi:ribosome-associated toxin RatA of RatAB toxin-antitoxin module
MRRQEVETRSRSSASAATVFALASDSMSYPTWSMIGSCQILEHGDARGIGERRIFRTVFLALLEEVVEVTPERRVSYVVHRGLPFRDYRADVDLEPIEGGGTSIRWRCSFYPKIRGTGWLCRAFMSYVLSRMAPALARHAERLERSGEAPLRLGRRPPAETTPASRASLQAEEP